MAIKPGKCIKGGRNSAYQTTERPPAPKPLKREPLHDAGEPGTTVEHLGKPRYGRARVTTIIRDFDRLRQAVRSHDTEAIEGAWLNCERWLDFVFGEAWRQSDG